MEPGDGRSMIREHVARREPDERPEDELAGGWSLAVLFREVREAEAAAQEARARLQRASAALHRHRPVGSVLVAGRAAVPRAEANE